MAIDDRHESRTAPPLVSLNPTGDANPEPFQLEDPSAPARKPDVSRRPAPAGMLRELSILFAAMIKGRAGWPIIRISVAILVILACNMVGQVRLNVWNGAFFDALENRNGPDFITQFWAFFVIIGVLLVLVVAQTWFQEMLKIRIRERLSHILLDSWLEPGRAYRLGFLGEKAAAPDQRMQEDCRLFAEFTTELGVGLLQSAMLLLTFVAVLWSLSSYVVFNINGEDLKIPGYMVWVAVVYAGIGSALTWLVGRPLIGLNTQRYIHEAEMRFALVRVNDNAEGIALYKGEQDERRNLETMLQHVLKATRRLSGALARLTWITSGYGWVAIVVPIIAAAPGYFSQRLTFGELMMVVGAFTQVQSALRYFVDNFPKIADWRSAVFRVSMFRRAMSELEQEGAKVEHITLEPHPEQKLSFDNLVISLIDGQTVIEDATAEIGVGERVLITGASGSGKSTLFRAIAGLWPWGQGAIRTPPLEQQMFMPQHPYLPLGNLRAAICYPGRPSSFPDDVIGPALERCGLAEFAPQLDTDLRWDKRLSLGQQQRVAFARLLLHKPRWVFMDEATSALDDEAQSSLLSLFENELAGTTVLSIAHRQGVEAFHTRTLRLIRTEEGTRLFGRRAANGDEGRVNFRRLLDRITGRRPARS